MSSKCIEGYCIMVEIVRKKKRKQIMASSTMHLQLLLFVSKMSFFLAACVQERVCLKNISR